MSAEATLARVHRPPGHTPTMAVAGAVDLSVLRAAGWQLRGTFGAEPYDDRLHAATYVEPAELHGDPDLDALALDGADPSLAPLLPDLVGHGLRLLLAGPAPLDVVLLQRVLRAGVAEDAADDTLAVTFARRFDPWLATVKAAAPLAGPPVQVTVRGWPRGAEQAAELVDLAATLCGDIVAAVAAPAPLPAEALPGGERVAWALLTSSGATVLVSHEGELAAHVSFPYARLLATPLVCRWEGGDRLPLLAPPAWVPIKASTDPTTYGALATAVALAQDIHTTGTPAHVQPALHQPDRHPPIGTVGDLLAAARVLQALRTSARTEALAPVA